MSVFVIAPLPNEYRWRSLEECNPDPGSIVAGLRGLEPLAADLDLDVAHQRFEAVLAVEPHLPHVGDSCPHDYHWRS